MSENVELSNIRTAYRKGMYEGDAARAVGVLLRIIDSLTPLSSDAVLPDADSAGGSASRATWKLPESLRVVAPVDNVPSFG